MGKRPNARNAAQKRCWAVRGGKPARHPVRPYKAFQATKSIYHRAWLDRANSGHLAVFVLMSEFGSLRAA